MQEGLFSEKYLKGFIYIILVFLKRSGCYQNKLTFVYKGSPCLYELWYIWTNKTVHLRNPGVQRNIYNISSQKRVNIDNKQICVTETVWELLFFSTFYLMDGETSWLFSLRFLREKFLFRGKISQTTSVVS